MAVKFPLSAFAVDHCAFAQVLAGLHKAALTTLAEAQVTAAMRKKANKGKEEVAGALPSRGAWAPLIEAYCRLDVEGLAKPELEKSHGTLALLLRYFALEQTNMYVLTIEQGVPAVEAMPECYRIYDGLFRVTGPGIGNNITHRAVEIFMAKLPERLQEMSDLPAAVRKVAASAKFKAGELTAKNWQQQAAIITALLHEAKLPAKAEAGKPSDAGAIDGNELRWETLGLLFREISFLQIYRRTYFDASS